MIGNESTGAPSPLPERGRSTREAGRVGVGSSGFNRTLLKTGRARALRSASTDVEAKLWQRLRNKQLGVDFRRQHPAGPYVLDFYCASLGLVIELDGGQHAELRTVTKDNLRTRWLSDRGLSVLRFWNSDVTKNLSGVLEAISAEIAHRRSMNVTPTRRWRADLPLSGGGNSKQLRTR